MSPDDEIRLRQLLDRAEIADVQLKYATCTDTLNWELFRTCFTDIVEIDFSSGMGLPVVHIKADAWVANAAAVFGTFKATQHVIGNRVVTLDDEDHATCVAGV